MAEMTMERIPAVTPVVVAKMEKAGRLTLPLLSREEAEARMLQLLREKRKEREAEAPLPIPEAATPGEADRMGRERKPMVMEAKRTDR